MYLINNIVEKEKVRFSIACISFKLLSKGKMRDAMYTCKLHMFLFVLCLTPYLL